MDNRLGGGRLRADLASYLDDHVTRLLTTGSYGQSTGRHLAAVCGELSQLAGWAAYDSDQHGLAQRYLTQAPAYARHAEDPGSCSRGTRRTGPSGFVSDQAGRGDRPCPRRAGRRCSARLGDPADRVPGDGGPRPRRPQRRAGCAAAIAQAERAFDRAAVEQDPEWLAYFDEAHFATRMAQCFRDLGDAANAARYALRSLDMDGRYVRGRAFNLSLLASAYVLLREPEQACLAGRRALDLTGRLSSARSVRYVRDVARLLSPLTDVPAVREFTAEVADRLPAAAVHAAHR
jgi:tetratricopeptide (TPR) repeat protein